LAHSPKAYSVKKSEQVSAWLIIVTGLIYGFIAAEQAVKGNVPMAIVYAGYSFSNAGLYVLATK
jgi:hypothetical protein